MSDVKAVKLTGKQQAFIDAYFACNFNGTAAARVAGYAGDAAQLATIASENLRKPNIRAQVDARMAEFHLSANEVLARLAYHAVGSFEDFVDPASKSIDLAKAENAKRLGHLKRFKCTTVLTSHADRDTQTETIEIELHDPLRALELVGKYHKLFTDKQEISGPDGGAIEVKPIDYRHSIAALTSGSDSDSAASGKD